MTKQARFIGEYPKVGIRPVIDGRQGGVRESLEMQTMDMAKNVANLISSELKYSDGTAVQCVIADSQLVVCRKLLLVLRNSVRKVLGL